jgi:hypothetical protein
MKHKLMKKTTLSLILIPLFLLGCGEAVSKNDTTRILAMGDSLLASHKVSGQAISNGIEKALGEPVRDRSVLGARILYALPISGAAGLSIPKQYRAGEWDWIILNGGGNDLWLGCGCILCNGKLNRLVAENGKKGAIPKLVSKLRKTGAKVIYVGYLRTPGRGSPIEHCKDEGDTLEARITVMADQDEGVYFLSLKELVPHGDLSYHASDRIHPSVKASKEIGKLVAGIIAE